MFVYYLKYLFLFRFVLTEKYKSIKAIEDDFYQKIMEGNCSGNFKLKAGYTADEKRVWRFLWTRTIALKILLTKSTMKKRKELHVENISI